MQQYIHYAGDKYCAYCKKHVRQANSRYCGNACRKKAKRKLQIKSWHKQKLEKFGSSHKMRLWNLYKLPPEEYDRMLRYQRDACAICFRRRKLQLDHDHKTGTIRHFLCSRCNVLVGYIETGGIALVRSAIRYIKMHRDYDQGK